MYPLRHTVLKMLHEEHMTTLGLLDRLDALLRRSGAEKPPTGDDAEAASLLSEVAANMLDESTHHFSFEEENLFPRFCAVAEPGIPSMLQAEHEAIRPLARRLAELAEANAQGSFSSGDWREFSGIGRELIEREMFHIQKEEMGFLPAMDQILGDDEAEVLAGVLGGLRGGA